MRVLRVALLLLFLLTVAPANAQTVHSEEKKAEIAARIAEIDATRKTRRSREEFRPRHRITRYLGAAAEKVDETDTAEAQALLEKLNLDRLNLHERALVHRMKAFVGYTGGDAELAIREFGLAIDQEILAVKDDTRMRYNIAQLYASLHKWPETIEAMNAWFDWEVDPEPRAYYLLAIAHFQLDKFEDAIGYAETAIDLAPDPQEGWLQLLAALYIQKEDYANAAPVLEELVLRFPKRVYWVQLSLIYGARDQYRNSLAVQQVAHAQGLLQEDKEFRRLARSYLHADLPYPAAQLLSEKLDDGTIEKDVKSYELLANSWIAAREYDKSLPPLRLAADMSEDGNLFMRLGQVYLQREDWNQAAENLDKALTKGGLKNPGNALLLLGISNYNEGRVGAARTYFGKARQHDESKPSAERWLKHLDTEAQQAAGEEVATAAQGDGAEDG